MVLQATLLIVPSLAAASLWPRRLASTGRAVAGLLPFRLQELATAVAEPALLGGGRRLWDSGLAALLAGRHLGEVPQLRLDVNLPSGPVAAALARTLRDLRARGFTPDEVAAFAARGGGSGDDADRLAALAALYRRFDADMAGFLDPAAIYKEAAARVAETPWLRGVAGLVVERLDVHGHERLFFEALARTVPLRHLDEGYAGTLLEPLAPPPMPPDLEAVVARLFAPPAPPTQSRETPAARGGVTFLTASSEANEVRAIARRILQNAQAGMPFEDMGVLLPRAEDYAALFSDLFERLGIPYRLHPSLPLRFGRAARTLLLLFRCRELERAAVMEFLTFVTPPEGTGPWPASQWDDISRDAAIVSGRERFRAGLAHYAEEQRREAQRPSDEAAQRRRAARAQNAESLAAVVERLAATLERLAGTASWRDWSERLLAAIDEWLGPEHDRDTVCAVVKDLGGLEFAAPLARFEEVERVVAARFEWERMPMVRAEGSAVHVGVFDALAGVPFRFVAIPGLVEGGFPGLLRPDPFLLDAEREALSKAQDGAAPAGAAPATPAATGRQLGLFEDPATPVPRVAGIDPLPTSQDRLLAARRRFRRALAQATESLCLSYPRADPRTGRERLPSLFFAAAASALHGRVLAASDLEALVAEDSLDALPILETLDASERDRARMRRGEDGAADAIAASSPHFRRSRHAAERRWSKDLTMYDGLVSPLPADLALRLDPTTGGTPVSASRLATFSQCGFRYMLQYVLKLSPTLEPEERLRLSPLERGDLFHRVAEKFLRMERDAGRLPLTDDVATRARLRRAADQALDDLAARSPPLFTALWERECQAFRELTLAWLRRELRTANSTTPIHFEVGFGPSVAPSPGEPHLKEPLAIDLRDGRVLRVGGKIDRIDRAQDGTLVLRDYKTGRAPKDDNRIFRSGSQLQIPFYVLAAGQLFPGEKVSRAFLDYVDGGRDVVFDLKALGDEAFTTRLRDMVDAIASGHFVQEPAACTWCDFKAVCGPQPHLELRRIYKLNDPRVRSVLRLRDSR